MKFTEVKGLTSRQVDDSRKTNGSNELPPVEIDSFWTKLIENFDDPLIKILCVALVITLLLSLTGYADWAESLGIAVAVFVATFVATYSEHKNENSFQELQEQASRVKSNVFRNGNDLLKIFVNDVVVDDKVLLQAGDKVPADGYLYRGEVQVNQSSLSGERKSVRKRASPEGTVFPDEPTEGDLSGPVLLLRGTVVDDGEGVMIVSRVGSATYYGRMQHDLFEGEERQSPLQVKLTALADGISTLGYVGATFIALAFLFKQFIMDNGYSLTRIIEYVTQWEVALNDVVTSLILAIIIIVVAVPEGLPMMISIVLSINMRKLLKAQVLVRRLLGIETAGSLNLLFADKTGTITRGYFEPSMFVTGDVVTFRSFTDMTPVMKDLYAVAVRESSSAVISPDGSIVGGNASDRALLGYMDHTHSQEKFDSQIVKQILFNSERKFAAAELNILSAQVAHLFGSTRDERRDITVVKGAPEILLAHARYYYDANGKRQQLRSAQPIDDELVANAAGGLRFIAIGLTETPLQADDDFPDDLTLLGVIGLLDHIRPESSGALATARDAGIKVIMMTGDRKETAVSVSKQIGLINENYDPSSVVTSEQLQQLSDIDLQALLPRISVIARARPTDKSRLVRIAQELDLVVGMTGDGVNDSIALRHADVGFAMGSGSEMAKESSDIVVLDDNFNSLMQATLYGRTIYHSIRKFIVFQSTVNVASGIVTFVGPFIGYDQALSLAALLWVNLVMDTLAALAMGSSLPRASYMREKPIARSQAVISPRMWSQILVNGIFIGILCIAFLTYDPIRDLFFNRLVQGERDDLVHMTAFFCFFIFLSAFNLWNCRTDSLNIFEGVPAGFVGIFLLIFGVQVGMTLSFGSLFHTTPLTIDEWISVILMSAIIIPFDTARKMLVSFVGL